MTTTPEFKYNSPRRQARDPCFRDGGGACSSAGMNTIAQLTLTNDATCTATFNLSQTGCAAQTICGTVTDAETNTIPLPGITIELLSAQGFTLNVTQTNSAGQYSFSNLTAPSYLLYCFPNPGITCSPFEPKASPGQLVNFFDGGYPASVTITGPQGDFVFFAYTQWSGPPNCTTGGICAGTAPATFSIPNGTYWLTCYNGFNSTQTSDQKLILKARDSLTLPCPP